MVNTMSIQKENVDLDKAMKSIFFFLFITKYKPRGPLKLIHSIILVYVNETMCSTISSSPFLVLRDTFYVVLTNSCNLTED